MIKYNKLIMISFFCGALIASLYAIRYPVVPRQPDSPTVEIDSDEKTTSTSPKKSASDNIKISIKSLLGSGDEISGFIEAPKELIFKHYQGGFTYRKKIFIHDVSSMEIISFQQNLIRTEKSRQFYEFKPSLVKILMKDKKNFQINYLFKFLHEFEIHTSNGVTTLYSFFADEFDKKKGWSEVESKNESYHKKNPHPQSIRKIWFWGKKDDEEE